MTVRCRDTAVRARLATALATVVLLATGCGEEKRKRSAPRTPAASWSKPRIASAGKTKRARRVVKEVLQADDELQRPWIARWPMQDVDVTSPYGLRMHPIVKRLLFHSGIDFRAARGTPVMSAGPGIVARASWANLTGKTVVVHHPGKMATLYAHLDEYLVFEGQQVDAGAPVGLIGSTGRSTAPHLHFSIYTYVHKWVDKKSRYLYTPLDPAEFIGRLMPHQGELK